jgi:elongation factor Ts
MAANSTVKPISMETIKKLRELTGAGVMDAKRALEDTNGDMEKAKDWIRAKGIQRAEKKSDREATAGVVGSYVHMGSQIAALVELNCETDFVARTDDFITLAREIAMQTASMDPKSVKELLEQPYIRDPKRTIEQCVKEIAGKVGENIVLKRFSRLTVGEK